MIDNASTDGTREWIRSLEGLPGITGLVRSERNDPAAALNRTLERCRGRYLHIMENDYVYLPGWDRYVLDRFARIPRLGQIGATRPQPRARGPQLEGLVFLARANVCTTSVLRREVFFGSGVRLTGHYLRGCYPNDHDLSEQVRRAGWLVAWPDVDLARNLGHEEEEFLRDPDYYIRDYALKLLSPSRMAGQARRWLRLDFHDTSDIVVPLARACWFKLTRQDEIRARGDVEGDGDVDLLSLYGATSSGIWVSFQVLTNDGTPGFTAGPSIPLPSGQPSHGDLARLRKELDELHDKYEGLLKERSGRRGEARASRRSPGPSPEGRELPSPALGKHCRTPRTARGTADQPVLPPSPRAGEPQGRSAGPSAHGGHRDCDLGG